MENKNQQPSAKQPVQQLSIQQQAVLLAKSNQSKLFLIIFILLVTIPGGIYFLSAKNISQQKTAIAPTTVQNSPTPTTDLNREPNGSAATANWKTYTDKNYNFSIQYPSTWDEPKIDKTYYNNSTYHVLLNSKPDGDFGNDIQIEIFSNPNKFSLLEYIKTEAFKNDLPGWNNDKQPARSLSLSGVDAIRIEELVGGAKNYGPVVFILSNGNIIKIAAINISEKDKNVFDQILSTFKFTPVSPTDGDQSQTTDTSNWKTYANEKYGFSFRYPFVFNEDDKLKFSEKTYLLTLSNGGDDEIKANYLTVYVAKIVDYKLDDRPAAFHFYFDSERKRWLHKETNDSSEFVPKRTNNSIESYIYKTGDANGSSKYLLIPSYSNGYIIEIINSHDRGDSGSYRKGYYNITSDQILSTFKFTN